MWATEHFLETYAIPRQITEAREITRIKHAQKSCQPTKLSLTASKKNTIQIDLSRL